MSYKVRLEIFEGPLDLLLHLIKKEEINIYDIPIAKITEQYLEYLEFMKLLDLNIAGEFLVMAATLMQIKSKMLLPKSEQQEQTEEEDPRTELVKRLLEYKKFKEAAEELHTRSIKQSNYFKRGTTELEFGQKRCEYFEASLFDLIAAFNRVIKDVPKQLFCEVIKDEFTVEDKIHEIFHLLVKNPVLSFEELFKRARNKMEIITTFLALLELIRLKEIIVTQTVPFGDISIKRNTEFIKPLARGSVKNDT